MAIIQPLLIKLVDIWFALIPRKHPSKDRIKGAKIIAHRGSHQGAAIPENSLDAFKRAAEAGVYGIELDVQYSRDNVPVVFHDEDLKRMFALAKRVDALNYDRLKVLAIPSLREVIANDYKCHLFIEIKSPQGKLSEKNIATTRAVLSPLTPVKQFHILSLNTEIFKQFDLFPPSTFLPISQWNYRSLYEKTIKCKYGGLTGHFVFINFRLVQGLKNSDLSVGTGQIASVNCLKRELNRGVDWIFTNHALKLQGYLKKQLKQ